MDPAQNDRLLAGDARPSTRGTPTASTATPPPHPRRRHRARRNRQPIARSGGWPRGQSAAGGHGLARPCAGRERLGDGSVGVGAVHTTDKYHRIGRFVAAFQAPGEQHQPGQHGEGYRASEDELDVLLTRLSSARDALATIGHLGDEQLDSVPPARDEVRLRREDARADRRQPAQAPAPPGRCARSGVVMTPGVSAEGWSTSAMAVVGTKRSVPVYGSA
jgi:hypothetical protein